MCTITRGQHFPAYCTTAHSMNTMQSSENNYTNRMEYHSQKSTAALQGVCEIDVCSRESSFYNIQMQGVLHSNCIQDAFGITIDAEDDPTTFPSCFCMQLLQVYNG